MLPVQHARAGNRGSIARHHQERAVGLLAHLRGDFSQPEHQQLPAGERLGHAPAPHQLAGVQGAQYLMVDGEQLAHHGET